MGMLTKRDAPRYTFAPSSIGGNFPGLDGSAGSDDVEDRVIAPIPNKARAMKEPSSGDALHRPKPEAQRFARPLENRARRGRRLPPAGAALEARVFQTPVFPAAAMRTAKAVRPAQLDQIVTAGRLGGEALRELRCGAQ